MKPLAGTYAANALAHGVAGLNIDGSRVGSDTMTESRMTQREGGVYDANGRHMETGTWRSKPNNSPAQHTGRWPANVLLDAEAAAMLGAPARYFYTAKASRSEREAGVKSALHYGVGTMSGDADGSLKTGSGNARDTSARNHHPTVKPIDLIRYLATLILPPKRETPRRILVPFSGSGSEMIACRIAGWEDVTGIEMDIAYAEIAQHRLDRWVPDTLTLEMEDDE